MASATLKCIICTILIVAVSGQPAILKQDTNKTLPNQGICKSHFQNSLSSFYETYKDCVVVIGNLTLSILERTTNKSFANISFPNLREVTGNLVVYRVNGLESLGLLFPNLARIRGERLINNYGLTIHDMPSLKEIGLYSLLQIDRGGVIIAGLSDTCYIKTINWTSIAPKYRHVISVPENQDKCPNNCTCSTDPDNNRCWNNKKCQIHLNGPEADFCNDLCLGCRKTNSNECYLCRYFTYNGKCLRKCPSNTILLPDCQYCITEAECHDLEGWTWNSTCVFDCPIGYLKIVTDDNITCELCDNCDKVCETQILFKTSAIQDAEPCVYINGSLEIHIRVTHEAMVELRKYLSRIREIQDYLLIYGSFTITSLDFLPSLRRIRGRNLKNDRYSLIVYEMSALKTLFTPKVTKQLKVDRGTVKMFHNPMLCMSEIDKIANKFPVKPIDADIPLGLNGYRCENSSVDLRTKVINETSVVVTFSIMADIDAEYSVLYVRVPPGTNNTLLSETCSDSEWHAVNIPPGSGHKRGNVSITLILRPASTYALCVETYDPKHRKLARSSITNFTTSIGTPEPPFIRELHANDTGQVVIKWFDHEDYLEHISHYEIDVSLINIYEKDIAVINQCQHMQLLIADHRQHKITMMPPPEYLRGCRVACGRNSTYSDVTDVQEFFDICETIDCNVPEYNLIRQNSSEGKYVRTLSLNLSNTFEYVIEGLAPFRDYRIRLRACVNSQCSRSARSVIKTLPLNSTDEAKLIQFEATELGDVSVKWTPPKITNGPILSYLVEILPNIEKLDIFVPISWCVLANKTELTVKVIPAKNYSVRVCTRSMGSDSVCSDWLFTNATKVAQIVGIDRQVNRWWVGLFFGIILYSVSIIIGYNFKRRSVSDNIDLEPILNSESSMVNESEPPFEAIAESSSSVMYSIPLRDTML